MALIGAQRTQDRLLFGEKQLLGPGEHVPARQGGVSPFGLLRAGERGTRSFCPGQCPYLPLQVLMLVLPADRAGSPASSNCPQLHTVSPLPAIRHRAGRATELIFVGLLSLPAVHTLEPSQSDKHLDEDPTLRMGKADGAGAALRGLPGDMTHQCLEQSFSVTFPTSRPGLSPRNACLLCTEPTVL